MFDRMWTYQNGGTKSSSLLQNAFRERLVGEKPWQWKDELHSFQVLRELPANGRIRVCFFERPNLGGTTNARFVLKAGTLSVLFC